MQQGCRSYTGMLCLSVPKSPAPAAPNPALPIPIHPLHCGSERSPLQTNVSPTCKSTGLLHTYLPLSYASLCIYYISYLQCVLLRFLEKISFHKKQRLCQPGATASPRGTHGNPSRQPVQPRQKYPQPRTAAETSPKLQRNPKSTSLPAAGGESKMPSRFCPNASCEIPAAISLECLCRAQMP